MKRKNKALTRNAHTEGTGLSEQNCQIHVISLLEHVLDKSAKGNKGHCCQRRSSEAVMVTVLPSGLSLEAGEWNHTSGECSLPSERQGWHIARDLPTAFSSNSQDTCFQKYLFLCFSPPRSPKGGHSPLGEQQQQGGPYKREQRQNCEK